MTKNKCEKCGRENDLTIKINSEGEKSYICCFCDIGNNKACNDSNSITKGIANGRIRK